MDNNEIWLEAVFEHFHQAVAEGNYALCKDILEDTKQEGFEVSAKAMETLLREETIGTFTYPSNEKTWN